MSEPLLGVDGRPMLSQEQSQVMQIAALRTNLYLSLIPVVAAKRLEQGENWKGGSQSDEIAAEADQITLSALRRMGISFAE